MACVCVCVCVYVRARVIVCVCMFGSFYQSNPMVRLWYDVKGVRTTTSRRLFCIRCTDSATLSYIEVFYSVALEESFEQKCVVQILAPVAPLLTKSMFTT